MLLFALLWGVGFAAFETTGLPWIQFDAPSLLGFAFDVTIGWTAIGLMVVGYMSYAVPRWPAPLVLLGHLAVAPASAFVYEMFGPVQIGRDLAQVELRATYSYVVWTVLAYGTLFIAWSIAAERAEATRHLLADAEIARRRGEAELGRARLRALQGQVDPALLLDVMAEVERRYRCDLAGADHLLDQLVAFLRSAMPAVRSGTSTLHAEVTLVRAWAALQQEFAPRRAAWQVLAPEHLPELAFPPLLLLPILDQLGAEATADTPLRLRVSIIDGLVRLEIDGPPPPAALDPGLGFRLRVGLQTVHGSAWTLTLRDAGVDAGACLTVVLPLDHRIPAAASGPDVGTRSIPPGASPWKTTPATTTT
jgi:hypothetical protein